MENPHKTYTIKLENLSIGHNSPIIENINTTLKAGEICLLLGKNGTGKSTLIKTLINQIPPISGNILINQQNIKQINRKELAKQIAIVCSHNIKNENLTTYDLVALGRYPHKQWYQKLNTQELHLIQQTMKNLEIWQYKDKKTNKLNDGNLQKTYLAKAIVQNTPVILLDEPTSHLDIDNQINITQTLKKIAHEQNKTIIFSSHNWDISIDIADKLWWVAPNKTLKTGYTEDIAQENNIIEQLSNKTYNYKKNKIQYQTIDIKTSNLKINYDNNNIELQKKAYWLNRAIEKNIHKLSNKKDKLEIQITPEYYILTINKEKKIKKNKIKNIIKYIDNK